MPTYDFRHLETGEEWESTMSWKDKDSYCKEHNCKLIIKSTPSFISSARDVHSMTDEGFKERMKNIKATGGSKTTLN